eukprot:jgi/Bigna1/129868/aug1.10_g4576
MEANQRDAKSPLLEKLKRLKVVLLRVIKGEAALAESHLWDFIDQAKGLPTQSGLKTLLLHIHNIERGVRMVESLLLNVIEEADNIVGSVSSPDTRSIVHTKVKRERRKRRSNCIRTIPRSFEVKEVVTRRRSKRVKRYPDKYGPYLSK